MAGQVTHVAIDLSASYARRSATPSRTRSSWPTGSTWCGSRTTCSPRSVSTPPATPAAAAAARTTPSGPPAAGCSSATNAYHAAFTRMWNALIDAGDPGMEVLHAYIVKENLRHLLALAGTDPDAAHPHRLWQFYEQAAACDLPEVHRLAATIEAWWPAIEAAIATGYSNARSEGYNRLAKHVGRDAFGFRNVAQPPTRHTVGLHPPTPASSATNTELPG